MNWRRVWLRWMCEVISLGFREQPEIVFAANDLNFVSFWFHYRTQLSVYPPNQFGAACHFGPAEAGNLFKNRA